MPVKDIHIAVISSSLSFGTSLCDSPEYEQQDDGAELIGSRPRASDDEGNRLTGENGFLAWDPSSDLET